MHLFMGIAVLCLYGVVFGKTLSVCGVEGSLQSVNEGQVNEEGRGLRAGALPTT